MADRGPRDPEGKPETREDVLQSNPGAAGELSDEDLGKVSGGGIGDRIRDGVSMGKKKFAGQVQKALDRLGD